MLIIVEGFVLNTNKRGSETDDVRQLSLDYSDVASKPWKLHSMLVRVFTTYRKSIVDTIMWDMNALDKQSGDNFRSFDFSLRQKLYISVLKYLPASYLCRLSDVYVFGGERHLLCVSIHG